MTTRRKFQTSLVCAVFAAPLELVAAPTAKVWRLGFLAPRTVQYDDEDDVYTGAFLQGLRALGYVEGDNLRIEWRSSQGRADLLAGLATELVNLKVDVIVTSGTVAARAAQRATNSIPIVVGAMGDPVSNGLVKSLAQPGGNLTGITILAGDIVIKQLELLIKIVPRLSRVALLVDPSSITTPNAIEKLQLEARDLGVVLTVLSAQTVQQVNEAFVRTRQENVSALIVQVVPFLVQQRTQILQLLVSHRLPSSSGDSGFVIAGGLTSYGTSLPGAWRQAAVYVDKIFRGIPPALIPIEQPRDYEIAINEKTAKALGLSIPRSVLVSATRVVR